MDKPLIFMLGILGLILLSIFFLAVPVFAYDYFDAPHFEEKPLLGIWDKTPKFCINAPKEQLWYSLRALDVWRDSYKDRTGSDGFNFKIGSIHRYYQMGCDIEVVNGEPSSIGANANSLGATKCAVKSNGFNERCIIVFSFMGENWYGTLQHEAGHTLGLGHYRAFNQSAFPAVILSGDIMLPQGNVFQKITGKDIDALVYYYGLDGFKNPPKVFKYTKYVIPHGK
jgi:hypothetical protein